MADETMGPFDPRRGIAPDSPSETMTSLASVSMDVPVQPNAISYISAAQMEEEQRRRDREAAKATEYARLSALPQVNPTDNPFVNPSLWDINPEHPGQVWGYGGWRNVGVGEYGNPTAAASYRAIMRSSPSKMALDTASMIASGEIEINPGRNYLQDQGSSWGARPGQSWSSRGQPVYQRGYELATSDNSQQVGTGNVDTSGSPQTVNMAAPGKNPYKEGSKEWWNWELSTRNATPSGPPVMQSRSFVGGRELTREEIARNYQGETPTNPLWMFTPEQQQAIRTGIEATTWGFAPFTPSKEGWQPFTEPGTGQTLYTQPTGEFWRPLPPPERNLIEKSSAYLRGIFGLPEVQSQAERNIATKNAKESDLFWFAAANILPYGQITFGPSIISLPTKATAANVAIWGAGHPAEFAMAYGIGAGFGAVMPSIMETVASTSAFGAEGAEVVGTMITAGLGLPYAKEKAVQLGGAFLGGGPQAGATEALRIGFGELGPMAMGAGAGVAAYRAIGEPAIVLGKTEAFIPAEKSMGIKSGQFVETFRSGVSWYEGFFTKTVGIGKPRQILPTFTKDELFYPGSAFETGVLEDILISKSGPEAEQIPIVRQLLQTRSKMQAREIAPVMQTIFEEHQIPKAKEATAFTLGLMKEYAKESGSGRELFYGSMVQKAAGTAENPTLSQNPRDIDLSVVGRETFQEELVGGINKIAGEGTLKVEQGEVLGPSGRKIFDIHEALGEPTTPGQSPALPSKYIGYGIKPVAPKTTVEGSPVISYQEQVARKFIGTMAASEKPRVLVEEGTGIRIESRLAPEHGGRIKDYYESYFGERADITELMKTRPGAAEKKLGKLERLVDIWDMNAPGLGSAVRGKYAAATEGGAIPLRFRIGDVIKNEAAGTKLARVETAIRIEQAGRDQERIGHGPVTVSKIGSDTIRGERNDISVYRNIERGGGTSGSDVVSNWGSKGSLAVSGALGLAAVLALSPRASAQVTPSVRISGFGIQRSPTPSRPRSPKSPGLYLIPPGSPPITSPPTKSPPGSPPVIPPYSPPISPSPSPSKYPISYTTGYYGGYSPGGGGGGYGGGSYKPWLPSTPPPYIPPPTEEQEKIRWLFGINYIEQQKLSYMSQVFYGRNPPKLEPLWGRKNIQRVTEGEYTTQEILAKLPPARAGPRGIKGKLPWFVKAISPSAQFGRQAPAGVDLGPRGGPNVWNPTGTGKVVRYRQGVRAAIDIAPRIKRRKVMI